MADEVDAERQAFMDELGMAYYVPFRVRVHTITLSVHLNDPFWLQTQTGTRIQRAVLPTSAQ